MKPSSGVCTGVERSRWACATGPHTRGKKIPAGRSAPQITTRHEASSCRSGEDTARLGTPEVVEGRHPDVDSVGRAPGQVAAEAEQPAGHQVLTGVDERLRGRDRVVEPRGVDPLETGQQGVEPPRTDGTRAPVDEHDRPVGTHQQVVVADVPVREVRGLGGEQASDEVAAAIRLTTYERRHEIGGQVGDEIGRLGPPGEDRRHVDEAGPGERRGEPRRHGIPASRSPSRSVAASSVFITRSSRRSAWRPATSSSSSATQAPSSYDARSPAHSGSGPISVSASTSRRNNDGSPGSARARRPSRTPARRPRSPDASRSRATSRRSARSTTRRGSRGCRHPGANRPRDRRVRRADPDRAGCGHASQPRRSHSQSHTTSPCQRWASRMCGEVGGTGSSAERRK